MDCYERKKHNQYFLEVVLDDMEGGKFVPVMVSISIGAALLAVVLWMFV